MMIEKQILTYKNKSYILYRELKKLEADYQKLIDISTKLELELENMINSLEDKLNAQRKDIVRIILENNELRMKIEAFRMDKSLEYSGIKPQATSTPLKSKKLIDLTDHSFLHQEKLDKLAAGIKELRIDFDFVLKQGISISEINLPQKIRALFQMSMELLLTSTPGKDRDKMIKFVQLLNVS
ncbi:unnamed protein product [Diamesa tonsa]